MSPALLGVNFQRVVAVHILADLQEANARRSVVPKPNMQAPNIVFQGRFQSALLRYRTAFITVWPWWNFAFAVVVYFSLTKSRMMCRRCWWVVFLYFVVSSIIRKKAKNINNTCVWLYVHYSEHGDFGDRIQYFPNF